MTAPDEQTRITSTQPGDAEPADGRESSVTGRESVASGEVLSMPEADVPVAESEPSADEPLFADGTLSGLRSRWDDVQAAFVDDPKDCVQKADALVARVVEQLTAGFSETRSRLEGQWARGEEASTEDLRVALKRYREFFERLLSV
jgi:hypothetical protein